MFLSELSKQACSRSKTISFSSHPSAPAVWGGGEAGGTGAAGCRVRCGAARRGCRGDAAPSGAPAAAAAAARVRQRRQTFLWAGAAAGARPVAAVPGFAEGR